MLFDLRKLLTALFFLSGSPPQAKLEHIIYLYRNQANRECSTLKNDGEITAIVKDIVEISLVVLPKFAMEALAFGDLSQGNGAVNRQAV